MPRLCVCRCTPQGMDWGMHMVEQAYRDQNRYFRCLPASECEDVSKGKRCSNSSGVPILVALRRHQDVCLLPIAFCSPSFRTGLPPQINLTRLAKERGGPFLLPFRSESGTWCLGVYVSAPLAYTPTLWLYCPYPTGPTPVTASEERSLRGLMANLLSPATAEKLRIQKHASERCTVSRCLHSLFGEFVRFG